MGVMLASLVLAAAGAVAADGHSVVPLKLAKPDSELRCDGPLKDAFLAPASAKGLGVRAPPSAGTANCTLIPAKGKPFPFALKFQEPKWPLAVGATGPVVLGQDKEAVLAVHGKALRADGSAGPANIVDGTVRAALPASKMPQNLVVLVAGEKGGAAYTVVPLLGRATVKAQTSKNAKVEALVAGHRTGGFTADGSGQVAIVVPAPPGFVKGRLDVTDEKGRTSHGPLGLPAAKPLFSLAVLGPADNVPAGSVIEVLAAGADPLGLPPKPKELKATTSAGKLKGLAVVQPGLWRVSVIAPASGDGNIELKLGTATRSVAFHVGAPKPAPVPEAPAVAAPTPAPTPTPAVEEPKVAEAPKPEPTPAPQPEPAKVEPKPEVAQAEPVKPEPMKVEKPAASSSTSGESAIRLELLVEGGYLTNGGSIGGLAPGAQLQVAYRTGSIDVGGGADALFSSATRDGQVSIGGASLATKTTTQSLQVLVGPWARYRFTDVVGVDLSAGAGFARTTQQINAGSQINAAGTTSPLALGGYGGLDLNFGIVRAFAGARYVTASASGSLTGQAGGLAGLAGVGVDLGL